MEQRWYLAADPDERRTWGTHSLAEFAVPLPARQRLIELTGHSPRRSNLLHINAWSSRGGGNLCGSRWRGGRLERVGGHNGQRCHRPALKPAA